MLLALAAYTISSEHYESVGATLSTDRFISKLDDLLSLVKDAETGQRGYLLTGKTRYLAPYDNAVRMIDKRVAEISAASQANGLNPERVRDLRGLVESKLAELKLTINLRQNGRTSAAMAEVDTGRGQVYMDQLRALVTQITDEQKGTLAGRMRRQRRDQTLLLWVLTVGVLSGLALLFFSFRFSWLHTVERDRAEAEIRLANEMLEIRVKERTQELEKRTAELERSNEDLLQFAYVASHDLQEPLRTVGNYIGLLARRYGSQLDDSAQTYMKFAIDGSRRMQTLITDLLAYSQAGTQTIEKRSIAAEHIVQTALKNLEVAIVESGALIVYANLPMIEADETKLTQVFQNLIGNAIRFRKPDVTPKVTIGTIQRSNEWVFTIADDGIGFEEKYTDRIFQVFQRLHGVGKYPGNGIGLAICKRIVEHHGGKLWARSKEGEGAIFSFSLPATGVITTFETTQSREADSKSSIHV